MKRLLIFSYVFFSLTYWGSSQTNFVKNYYIKLSAGQVLFGTGDVVGFSINIEGSKNIIKSPKKLLNKLLVGGEFVFENGSENPVVNNPTSAEFLAKSFHHESNTIFIAKVTYYPFGSVIKGFNIAAG
ncbi:MAG: hypothetical protein M3352_06515, partial [Bacteroidota bacterium]|nr:hypothetical protein [Bacteroidota bacterium]